VFFLIGFIPFIKVAGAIGMLVLFILVPIRLIHWRVKYGGIQTKIGITIKLSVIGSLLWRFGC